MTKRTCCVGVWQAGEMVTCVFATSNCPEKREYCYHSNLDGVRELCPNFCEVETEDGYCEVVCDLEED